MQYNLPNTSLTAGNKFSIEGGVLTTELYLASDPNASLEAAPKRYVDSKITAIAATSVVTGTMPIGRFPGFVGDFSNVAGSNVLTLKNSGVSAGTYPKVSVTAKGIVTQGMVLAADDVPNLSWSNVSLDRPTTLIGFGVTDALSKTGGTMTGFISVMNAPSQTLHAANKSYVDNYSVSSGGSLAVGTIVRMPQTSTPTGYLRCNGALVSKTSYPELYTIFGDNVTTEHEVLPGSGQPWCQQYQFNTTQSGDIAGWATGPTLPSGVIGFFSTIFATKNRVYLLGVYNINNGSRTDVYTTAINGDGTLGGWTLTTPFPVNIEQATVVITKNRVYVLGGWNGVNETYYTATYHAAINTDGTLGSWVAGSNLPGPLSGSSSVITKNRVYVFGGSNGYSSSTSDIYTAQIDSDGIVGTWGSGGTLPGSLRFGFGMVVTNNKIHLLGGYNGSGYSSTIYTTTVNTDGTLGTWVATSSLPLVLYHTETIVTKNRVYLLGGTTPSAYISTVHSAPINADGTLGTWGSVSPLPLSVGGTKAVCTSSKIYIMTGFIDGQGAELVSSPTSTYVANFSGGLNDYSSIYSTGYTVIDPDNFRLPDFTSLETTELKYYIKY